MTWVHAEMTEDMITAEYGKLAFDRRENARFFSNIFRLEGLEPSDCPGPFGLCSPSPEIKKTLGQLRKGV